MDEVLEMVNVDDRYILNEPEFKKTVTDILESLSLQLGANPIFVSSNLVIDEPSSTSPTSVQSD